MFDKYILARYFKRERLKNILYKVKGLKERNNRKKEKDDEEELQKRSEDFFTDDEERIYELFSEDI